MTRSKASRRAVASMVLLLGALPAAAQQRSDRERRQEVVGGILRLLIDGNTPRYTPGPAPNRQASPEMAQARNLLNGFSGEAQQLIAHLGNDVGRVEGVRPLFNDALRLRASASLIAQKSAAVPDIRSLADDVSQLDRDWRLLSHRLSRLRGLGEPCRRSIATLTEHDKRLCELFHLDPQFDRRELARMNSEMSHEIRTLVEELAVDVWRSNQRGRLLIEGRKMQQQLLTLTDFINRGATYDMIVAEYQRFDAGWQQFVLLVRQLESRSVDRAVSRVHQMNQTIRELLWLPRTYDRQYLVHATQRLRKHSEELFGSITLLHLVAIDRLENVLPAANQFFGLCEHFVDCVQGSERPDDFVYEYRQLDDAWSDMARMFSQIKDPAIQRMMKEIEQQVYGLRQYLGLSVELDYERAAAATAALEDLSEHLLADVRRWFPNAANSHQAAMLQDAMALHAASKHLNQVVQSRAERAHLQKDCQDAGAIWTRIAARFPQFPAHQRVHLEHVAEQITQSLAELQTLILL